MRKRKHLVETIAQMARFNPFFEKVGFKYVWDTASVILSFERRGKKMPSNVF